MKKNILMLLMVLFFSKTFCSEEAGAAERKRYIVTRNAVIVLEQGQTYDDPMGYYVEVTAEPGRSLIFCEIEEIQQSIKDLMKQREQEEIQAIMGSLQNENT